MSGTSRKAGYAVGAAIGVVLACAVSLQLGHRSFSKKSAALLRQVAETKILELESSLNSQLLLAVQMTKSPTIQDYLENPADETLSQAALKEFESYRSSFTSNGVFWVSDTSHEFYNNMQFQSVLDPSKAENSWYNMTLFDTEVYNFNINYNSDIKQTMLWVNAPVRKNGRGVGVVGTGISITAFVDSMYSGLDRSLTMYLYDENAVITGAADSSLLGRNVSITSRLPALKGAGLQPGAETLRSTASEEYIIAPIPLVGWYVVIAAPFTLAERVSSASTTFSRFFSA